MLRSVHVMNDMEQQRALGLLNAVGENSQISQRELAKRTGVALGLVNSYLKRCINKGWIKISEAPANRYLYYLTPKGFSEKARLSTQYLSDSFTFYRLATSSCEDLLRKLVIQKKTDIVLAGASDLAEIMILKSLEIRVHIVSLYDPEYEKDKFVSIPVSRQIKDRERLDAVIVTSIVRPDLVYEDVQQYLAPGNIFVPEILTNWFGFRVNEISASEAGRLKQ